MNIATGSLCMSVRLPVCVCVCVCDSVCAVMYHSLIRCSSACGQMRSQCLNGSHTQHQSSRKCRSIARKRDHATSTNIDSDPISTNTVMLADVKLLIRHQKFTRVFFCLAISLSWACFPFHRFVCASVALCVCLCMYVCHSNVHAEMNDCPA